MIFSYKPLMHKIIELEISKMELVKKANISGNVLARIGKNKSISMESIGKICLALNCTPNDIFEVLEEGKKYV